MTRDTVTKTWYVDAWIRLRIELMAGRGLKLPFNPIRQGGAECDERVKERFTQSKEQEGHSKHQDSHSKE